jgi:hypothetical protein
MPSVSYNVAICHISEYGMSRSLRLSDTLFDAAQEAATALSRSAAQQVEHWARLGRQLELRGLTLEGALKMLASEQVTSADALWRDKRARQARDHARDTRREGRFGDTHWISAEDAKRAKVLDGPY